MPEMECNVDRVIEDVAQILPRMNWEGQVHFHLST